MVDSCRALLSLLIICDFSKESSGTIDLNLQELEYLAAHLRAKECRLLVAALHFNSYELPKQLSEAGEALFELHAKEIESIIWLSFGSLASLRGGDKQENPVSAPTAALELESRRGGRQNPPTSGASTASNRASRPRRLVGQDDVSGARQGRAASRQRFLRSTCANRGDDHYGPTTTGKSVETNSSSSSGGDGDGDLYLLLVIDMIVVGLVAGSLFSLVFVVGSLVIGRVARCDDRRQRRRDPNDRSLIDRDCEAADCRDDDNDASDDYDTSFENFNDAVQWQIAPHELQTRSEEPLNAINDSHHYTEYLVLPPLQSK
ncbi:unnamed protein product [Trichogramma brassicae]|uniref:Uncharacterized protein n=1 Tax=Trichogramma brassicae TaxID=86971 RepID=A0A6H5HW57_9HYME|nr:unnamed protein product [Trichogramma brassicae]